MSSRPVYKNTEGKSNTIFDYLLKVDKMESHLKKKNSLKKKKNPPKLIKLNPLLEWGASATHLKRPKKERV